MIKMRTLLNESNFPKGSRVEVIADNDVLDRVVGPGIVKKGDTGIIQGTSNYKGFFVVKLNKSLGIDRGDNSVELTSNQIRLIK